MTTTGPTSGSGRMTSRITERGLHHPGLLKSPGSEVDGIGFIAQPALVTAVFGNQLLLVSDLPDSSTHSPASRKAMPRRLSNAVTGPFGL